MEPTLILVAVNALNGREAAFERALTLARRSGAELYLLHAVPANQPFSHGAAERLERISDMRRRAEEAGVRAQSVEQHGDPAQIIELHANARRVDLIVMGGEPRRGWGRHRSAVGEKVIRRTKVPTLVVPSDAPDQPISFRNVLVAVDLSPGSEEIVRRAIGFSSDDAAQLTLIHTVKGVEAADAVQSPARWMVPEYRTHVLEDARRRLEALAGEVPAGVDTRVHLSTGPAVRTILEQAADLNADLVVVGRSRGFKMLGSTALHVLRKNDRALLVIPSVAPRVERKLAA
ncbi:MAG TPA: universal stress protein [Vicinamibacterales bacterium]|nr:universal stress protein [Vicinamibacterales bacterium]